MTRWVRCTLAAALVAGASASGGERGDCMVRWTQGLWPKADSVTFEPTTLEERAAFALLVPRLLAAAPERAEPPAALVSLAGSVGFRLDSVADGDQVFWVLREQEDRRRGAGAYVFRTGAASDDVVQAPHAYFDQGTGELAARLFACAPAGRRPRLFMTNTAHRYRGRPGEQRHDPDHPADLSHNPDHLFTLVTDLVARVRPQTRVLQLHGFGAAATREAVAAVVSPGLRRSSPWIHQVSTRLSPLLGEGVRRYPEEAEFLGGTRNAQARVLQAHPRARFLHLELSAPSRRALETPERLAEFAAALLAPEEE